MVVFFVEKIDGGNSSGYVLLQHSRDLMIPLPKEFYDTFEVLMALLGIFPT